MFLSGKYFFILICGMTVFLCAFKTIFEYYINYSKKYKDFHIIPEVSKIANNRKILVILDIIVWIYPHLLFWQIIGLSVFDCVIELFGKPGLNVKLKALIVEVNDVVLYIWFCFILITSIYYIIAYIKAMKATK